MPPTGRMRYLTTVQGTFHGRVLAARLGAEGVLTELRGVSEGPYPLQGAVEVFVGADQLELAREILLADAVDAAVDAEEIEAGFSRFEAATIERPEEAQRDGAGPFGRRHARRAWLGTAVAIVLVVALVAVGLAVTAL